MESFARYSLGEFGAADESSARADAYAAVQESHPVFRLLSEQHLLPQPTPSADEPARKPVRRQRPAQVAHNQESTTPRLLLVGRAGSGKTTTLRYGALMLARAILTGKPARCKPASSCLPAHP